MPSRTPILDRVLATLDRIADAVTRERYGWGAEDLLTREDVLRRLGMRHKEAAAWLDKHVRPRVIAGRKRYRWGDVIAATDASASPAPVEKPRLEGLTFAEP
jgi:hypothetical protein